MKSIFWTALIMTFVIELATIMARFMFKLESTRDTAALAVFTFGYRIHHGYIGLLIIAVLLLLPKLAGSHYNLIMALAISLVASDLIHHFLVLWITTGDPQFDLRYPD